MLRPLRDDPAAMETFRRETLYAPLEGTVEAKRSAQEKALAAMGMSLDEVDRRYRLRQALKERQEADATEGKAGEVSLES